VKTKNCFQFFKTIFYISWVKLPAQEHGQISATIRPSFKFDGRASSWEILSNVEVQAAESRIHASAFTAAIMAPVSPNGSEHAQRI
jgi:hypothetical protein